MRAAITARDGRALRPADKRLKRTTLDFMTPVEEVMRLHDLVVQEKCSTWAIPSDTPGAIVSQANTLAQVHGGSSLDRKSNTALHSANRNVIYFRWRARFTAWSPLAGGILSGKYAKETEDEF